MPYIKNLEEIVNINSYTKNKDGVDKVGKKMSLWLEEIGFSTKVYKREEIGNHFLHSSTKKSNLPKILLLGHNDTVFPENTFEGFSKDKDWIYGPGVCDMKGGNIVALQALRNVYANNNSIHNVDFLLVSDEESGSDDSKLLSSSLAKEYDYCFVFEAAGQNDEVVSARKGVGTFVINIEGLAAHAGNHYSKGIDANLEASYKLQELVKLTNLELGTTCNVGRIKGGIGANTISPGASITLEIRYTQSHEKSRLLNALETICKTSYVKGSRSHLSGSIQRDVMEQNDKQEKLLEKIYTITGEKLIFEKRGGVSDANIIAAQGTTTLDGFGPYGDGDHTKNERACLKTFEDRINLMTKILSHFQVSK